MSLISYANQIVNSRLRDNHYDEGTNFMNLLLDKKVIDA
tara:strand:+ start:757 stop:873 length:117 start_codon:yes stop_codon:yes gene_type:complete